MQVSEKREKQEGKKITGFGNLFVHVAILSSGFFLGIAYFDYLEFILQSNPVDVPFRTTQAYDIAVANYLSLLQNSLLFLRIGIIFFVLALCSAGFFGRKSFFEWLLYQKWTPIKVLFAISFSFLEISLAESSHLLNGITGSAIFWNANLVPWLALPNPFEDLVTLGLIILVFTSAFFLTNRNRLILATLITSAMVCIYGLGFILFDPHEFVIQVTQFQLHSHFLEWFTNEDLFLGSLAIFLVSTAYYGFRRII